MSRILITGANGFLGRNLVAYLRDRHELLLVDLPTHRITNHQLEPFDTSLHIEYLDVTQDLHKLNNMLEGVDIVIHCANQARIDPSWSEYQSYYTTNISGSQKFFELCQQRKVKRFIYISSSSVYGNNGQEIQTEDGALNPSNPYAVSKLAAEWALRVQSQKVWITELIIVRPFTMYGPCMDYSNRALMIPKFLKCFVAGDPLLLHGDGLQERDFLFSGDAVRGIELIFEQGQRDTIYNLGSGKSYSVKQIADSISNKQVKTPDRLGPIRRTQANISKIQQLGFEPKTDVIDWITDQIAIFNQHKKESK